MKPDLPALLLLVLMVPTRTDAEELGDALNLEAHGFASFGYLHTRGNNWLEQGTTDGSTDLYEAAVNAIARPTDRLRLGAQLFTRRLGRYDTGIVALDWAYADWRAADVLGIQVGRVKIPLGLYNDALDIDAARTPVFLPPSIYALRSRDLLISIDGVKLYGLVALKGAGSLEYAVFAGRKTFNENAGFARNLAESGYGERIDRISMRWGGGGIVHWNTPVAGLAVRASVANISDFRVEASTPSLGLTTESRVPHYLYGILSVQYETEVLTLAAEYGRIRGHGQLMVQPLGLTESIRDDHESGYTSATWHAKPWLDLYGAFEVDWARPSVRDSDHAYTAVFACNLLPLRHWSVKAEIRDVHGTLGTIAADNPDGVRSRWQVLALKTTLDF